MEELKLTQASETTGLQALNLVRLTTSPKCHKELDDATITNIFFKTAFLMEESHFVLTKPALDLPTSKNAPFYDL